MLFQAAESRRHATVARWEVQAMEMAQDGHASVDGKGFVQSAAWPNTWLDEASCSCWFSRTGRI